MHQSLTQKNMNIGNQYNATLLVPEDATSLHQLIQSNAKRLHQYFPITAKENLTPLATEKYIAVKMGEVARNENYTFKINDTVTQLPIGLLIIKKINLETKSCEFAYFIDKNYEGKGIISMGMSQLIDFAKHTLGLQKALLAIGNDNPGSLRIAEKHNFKLVKTIKNGHKDFHGNIMDVLHFELNMT